MKISSFTICLNEDEMIGQMIEYLQDVVDEIVIVDGGSTDNTLEVIKRYQESHYTPLSLYERSMPQSFSDQRNYALERCSGDWVLWIDADEKYTPSLKRLLPELMAKDRMGYSIPTFHLIKDDRHYGNIENEDPHVRLFRNTPEIRFTKDIHEVPTYGETVLSPHRGQCDAHGVEYRDDIRLMHYGPLKSMDSLKKKQIMWNQRNYVRMSNDVGAPMSEDYFIKMNDWQNKEMWEVNLEAYV